MRGGLGAVAAVVSAAWIVAIAGMPGSALAADPAASWAYDLAGELMSPFCPGRTLASCPSPQAAEMIQWIATQEAAGSTREEVVAILVERHGEEILGAPPARGIGLWAYLLPVLGFVGFGAVVLIVLRRIVAPAAQTASPSGGAAPAPAVAGAAAAATSTSPGAAPSIATAASAAAIARVATNDELARIVDAELAERA